MPKETTYKAQLQEMGIYNEAFDVEIHQLCILERELSRAQKAWKATAPSKDVAPNFTDPHYDIINKLRRDILAHRDALGLTPKALQRLKGKTSVEITSGGGSDPLSQRLDALMEKVSSYE